jgi:hypothetical protein
MSAFYEAKFEELFAEFTRYLIEHPEIAERIPDNAEVVSLDKNDPQYSQYAIERSKRSRLTDDMSDRPVIYLEVTEMGPVRSRVKHLEVHERPPAYST